MDILRIVIFWKMKIFTEKRCKNIELWERWYCVCRWPGIASTRASINTTGDTILHIVGKWFRIQKETIYLSSMWPGFEHGHPRNLLSSRMVGRLIYRGWSSVYIHTRTYFHILISTGLWYWLYIQYVRFMISPYPVIRLPQCQRSNHEWYG